MVEKNRRKRRAKSSEIEPPLRKVSHRERLSLGKKITAKLVAKYKDVLLAVCIYGSTAKKLERPYSDLEIFCVLSDRTDIPPMKYLVHNGLIIAIEYLQASKLLGEARKASLEWPIQADQYRNHIVLFEKNLWLKKLDKAAEISVRADFRDAIRNAAMAMTESLAAVRNAHYKHDPVALRSGAYWMAMDTAKLVFLLNKRYVLTSSWFWKQAFECPQKPKEFRKLVNIAAGFVNSTEAERVDAVEKLWRGTIGIVHARGITIESSELIV